MSNPVSRQRLKSYVKPRQPVSAQRVMSNPVSRQRLKGYVKPRQSVSAQRVMSNPVSRQRLKGYVKPRQPSALKGLCIHSDEKIGYFVKNEINGIIG